jgi:hypothetical protein
MGIKYEVTATTGTYTTADGTQKKRYAKIGVVLDTKNGPALKLETIPVGWDGFAYLNEPQPKADEPRTRKPAARDRADDDVPF